MTIYKHYTYIISNIKDNKHYIGARTCKQNFTPETDLGFKYFSSSTDEEFLEDQKINPQNYTYQVINKYQLRKEAIWNEICLHKIFDVGVNPNFYNKVRNLVMGYDCFGIKRKQSSIDKKSLKMKTIESNGKTKQQNTNAKAAATITKINTNGTSISKEAAKKGANARAKIRENGTSINQENGANFSKRLIESGERKGSKNSRALKINIFNERGILMFKCFGNFKEICKENNLPIDALIKTYKNKTFLYESSHGMKMATKSGYIRFKGWYARII